MTRFLLLALALCPTAALSAPMMSVFGTCSTDTFVDIHGLSPHGQFAVVSSSGLGLSTVPGGRCAGTVLDLNPVELKVRRQTFVTESGIYTFLLDEVPPNLCGGWIQVIDLRTCETSNVAKLADNEVSFRHTGGVQWFQVPVGVTTLDVSVDGAAGGAGDTAAGRGGAVRGPLTVYSGELLDIRVGGRGAFGTGALIPGGYNGGGDAIGSGQTGMGASGGGASDIRRMPGGLDDRLVVAGGGGAGSWDGSQGEGGAGGGLQGLGGTTNDPVAYPAGGGATQFKGGWASGLDAEPGAFGQGGDCTVVGEQGCGAGGGGWYGGGAGTFSGGGGGSSAVPAFSRLETYEGGAPLVWGEVVLRW